VSRRRRRKGSKILRQRKAVEDRLAMARRMPHRRGFADALDHRLVSCVGRLAAARRISDPEFQAAVKYNEIVHRYRVSIGCPRAKSSASLDGEFKGIGFLPDDRVELRSKAYNRAHDALMGDDVCSLPSMMRSFTSAAPTCPCCE
jgi:hypothetical protein